MKASTTKESRSSSDAEHQKTHTIKVYDGSDSYTIEARHGRNLRAVLMENDVSPHGWLTQYLNCQGQGHCAACTVQIQEGAPNSDQWLDAFMAENDLGRLSCQVDVIQDLAVRVG